ncbi:hypothetical protein Pfo_028143 [Paulownia fortunei]|nr:hypothetical protein Pfo_028143 [Paulownia fortunei]
MDRDGACCQTITLQLFDDKEVGATVAFKSIHLAYDILINETTRSEYDQALRHLESTGRPLGDEWAIHPEILGSI